MRSALSGAGDSKRRPAGVAGSPICKPGSYHVRGSDVGAGAGARVQSHAQKKGRKGNCDDIRHLYRIVSSFGCVVPACDIHGNFFHADPHQSTQPESNGKLLRHFDCFAVCRAASICSDRCGDYHRSGDIQAFRRFHSAGKVYLRGIFLFITHSRAGKRTQVALNEKE